MRTTSLVLAFSLLTAGCADPVIDAEIDALPGEVPGIPRGPTHRGGQPCTLCHSSYGGRHPTFSLAGTVYQKLTNEVPIEGALIQVTDATGTTRQFTSNCAGNFYVPDTDWEPTFPLFIDLSDPATDMSIKMISKIGRDSSCASCHADPAGADSPGHVYLTSDASVPNGTAPPLTCGR
jgi:hypothetical protein